MNSTWFNEACDAYSLKRITGPTVFVAAPGDVCAWAQNIETIEESLILDKIKSATEMIEQQSNRVLCDQTWELRLAAFPCGGIQLPRGPWQSITTLKYYATDGTLTTLASTEYLFDEATGWVTPIYGGIWPTAQYRVAAVQVRFLAGYGPLKTDPPSIFKDCVIDTVVDWMENRHGRFRLPNGVIEKLAAMNPGTVMV